MLSLPRILTLLALCIYFCWGALFILQKPGLQEDEALIVTNAIHIHLKLHGGDPAVVKPSGWVALPLMSADYVGSIKDYLTVPFIEVFGIRASVIRVVSLLLGAIGIWGIAILISEQVGALAGAAVALALAMNPSYLNMVVFDNNSIGAMMAAFGLLCAALAWYLRRGTWRAAWLVGAAAGFGIWARANFMWTEIAAAVALLVVYRREALKHLSQWRAFVYGALAGGSPFLLYQLLSRGATWRAQQALQAKASLASLFAYRGFLLAEVLLSEGEHRRMWGNTALPTWQVWVFPIAVIFACVICVLSKSAGGAGRAAVVTMAVSALFLFATGLKVAEHHFIVLVPLAAMIVIVAARNLNAKFRAARWGIAAFALLYCACATYWNIETVRGLQRTGGKGDWSDAMIRLADDLNRGPAGVVTVLDWGLSDPVYVLTRGRLTPRELFWADSATGTGQLSWKEVIEKGGTFLLTAPQNRHFPAAADEFQNALDQFHPVAHRKSFYERDGTPFAEVVEVEPVISR